MVLVDGRRVYVNTQKTQTVKVCTSRNVRTEYEKFYRIQPPLVLDQRKMEQKVSDFTSLADLEQWLVNDRKAQREPEHEFTSNNAPVNPADGSNTFRTRYIKYCPNCKGDLEPRESNNRPPETSSRFKCDVCRRVYEINDNTATANATPDDPPGR
jgi:hypothetical protein